jgi:hypothetical protein
MSLQFKNSGMAEEAQRLFALAEPISLLSSPALIEDDPQDLTDELLQAWAEVAIHFRDCRKVIEIIRHIRREPKRSRGATAESATVTLRNRMPFGVGTAFLDNQRWDELAALRQEFGSNGEEGVEF